MLNDYFNNSVHELRGALHKRKHPFKYVTLSTVDEDNAPHSRTVVLREVSESLDCIFFTDARTAKVKQLYHNSKACVIAYHPKKLLQIKLNGYITPVTDPAEVKRLFQKVSENAIKDYTTSTAPASSILNPDHLEYLDRKENYFLALRFTTEKMECLQLKRPNHLRAVFHKNDNWTGQWIVP